MSDIKKLIQGKMVRFTHYRQGELWFKTDDGFVFPVPVSDLGEATAKAEEKAIFYMRWIRKYIAEIAEAEGLKREG